MLNDINIAQRLGLIDNQGVANALRAKVGAAQRAADRGRITAALNILSALKSEVAAQSGKHISKVVSEILLQDVAAIASQVKR